MSIRAASDFIQNGVVDAETSSGERVPINTLRITSLDLSDNRVSSKKHLNQILRNFPNLRRIDASSNRLRTIDQSPFDATPHLDTIIMKNNPRLAAVSKSLLRHSANLRRVDLRGNPKLPDCFRESFDNVRSNEDFKDCIGR